MPKRSQITPPKPEISQIPVEERLQEITFQTIVVAGGSRGIRLAVAEHLMSRCDRLLSVSRTQATFGEWIQADLSDVAGVEAVAKAVGSDRLDALLYMGGTWETDAFTSRYCFETCSDEDIFPS